MITRVYTWVLSWLIELYALTKSEYWFSMIRPSYRGGNVQNLDPGRVNCQARAAAPRARDAWFFFRNFTKSRAQPPRGPDAPIPFWLTRQYPLIKSVHCISRYPDIRIWGAVSTSTSTKISEYPNIRSANLLICCKIAKYANIRSANQSTHVLQNREISRIRIDYYLSEWCSKAQNIPKYRAQKRKISQNIVQDVGGGPMGVSWGVFPTRVFYLGVLWTWPTSLAEFARKSSPRKKPQ
jgi:hypothetical protein